MLPKIDEQLSIALPHLPKIKIETEAFNIAIENNKTKHHNEERVCNTHSKADALKAKVKPFNVSSAILGKFGVKLMDKSNKPPGNLPINSYKSGDKTDCSSPAKTHRLI